MDQKQMTQAEKDKKKIQRGLAGSEDYVHVTIQGFGECTKNNK